MVLLKCFSAPSGKYQHMKVRVSFRDSREHEGIKCPETGSKLNMGLPGSWWVRYLLWCWKNLHFLKQPACFLKERDVWRAQISVSAPWLCSHVCGALPNKVGNPHSAVKDQFKANSHKIEMQICGSNFTSHMDFFFPVLANENSVYYS